jgi:hypothetical protein
MVPRRGLSNIRTSDSHLARSILCFGDSTVEGVTGGFDFWIQILRQHFGYLGLGWRSLWRSEWTSTGDWTAMDWKRDIFDSVLTTTYRAGDRTMHVLFPVGPSAGQFLLKVDNELFFATGGNGTDTLSVIGGQCSTTATDHAQGAKLSNPCNIGPYQSGHSTVGGDGAVYTWTRPSTAPEEHDLAASFQIAVCCGEGAGDSISTSVDGGSTWQAAAVTATGPPAIELIRVPGGDPATSTIEVRAADTSGNASAILGLFGLMAYPSGTGRFDAQQTIISNFAHSEDYLFNLNGTAVEDQVSDFHHVDNSTSLVTVGPYTNDIMFGKTSLYYTNIVNLARHYSDSPVLVVGAFEQQGIESYPCSVVHGSRVITISSRTGNLAPDKDGPSGARWGRPVWVTGHPNGGNGLPDSTSCDSVIDSNSCVLSNAWSGRSGKTSLAFGGRDIATQNAFRAKAKAAAMEVGCAYLDLRAYWGTFRTAYAAGLMHGALHESQKGHRDIAARIQRLVQIVSPEHSPRS